MKHFRRIALHILFLALAAGTVAQDPAASSATPAPLHPTPPVGSGGLHSSNSPAQPPWLTSPYSIPPTDAGLPGAGPILRDAWFEQLWVLRRTEWAQHIQQDQGALVFLGDAAVLKWGDQMGGSFPGVKVANRGISGDTSRGALIRLKEDVLTLHPSGVVLLIGGDDLEDGAPPETTAGNLRLIVAAIKASYPKIPIILCQVFPSAASKKRPAGAVQKLNQLCAAAIKGDPQVALVETWRLFANNLGDAKPQEFPDLLLPNPAGYAKLAAALRPLLATCGLMDNAPDPWTPDPGFTSLFNGRDLAGWGYVTNNFDGKTNSLEGRYLARNGRLIATASPNDSGQKKLWTTRVFSRDFTLKLQFRAMPCADSGIFIREPLLPCRDHLLAGPYTKLAKYRPQDWNEIVISVTNNTAHCACNGEILEAALPVPPTGPIGLEADRGQVEYRHIEYQEGADAK
jgi:lysophospholipase L1-like esterase